jgi:hypothetical protein
MPAAYLEKLNSEQRRAVEHGVRENACAPTEPLLVGGPEQAALVGVVVLAVLVEEARLGARREVVPAIGFEHGAVHGGVQLAQALDVVAFRSWKRL